MDVAAATGRVRRRVVVLAIAASVVAIVGVVAESLAGAGLPRGRGSLLAGAAAVPVLLWLMRVALRAPTGDRGAEVGTWATVTAVFVWWQLDVAVQVGPAQVDRFLTDWNETFLLVVVATFLIAPRRRARWLSAAVLGVGFVVLGVVAWRIGLPAQTPSTILNALGTYLVADGLAGSVQAHQTHGDAARAQAALGLVDDLTGLRNRRGLLPALAAPGMAALLLLDVDEFKAVNDGHGHAVGDEVLVAVAAALRAAVRDGDVVGRWGGEEFLVVLHHTAGDVADVAERLRRGVAAAAGPVAVTASVGGAVVLPDDAGWEDVLRRADTAMYAAKGAGRDRVVVELA